MTHKYFYIIFLAFNFQAIEPKVSFVKKAKNFFRDPDNKKMMLNIATAALCATGVSLIVSYRHELAQLLWGDGYYYADPFVNPIFIGDYECKGLEREYKGIKIKQIRIPQQSGAQCGLYALVSATSWIEGNNQNYVALMQDNKKVRDIVNQYLNENQKTKELKGQWVGDTELMDLYTQLKEQKKIHDNSTGNNLIVIAADKADLGNEIKPSYLYKEIEEKLMPSEDNKKPLYCSIVVGSMKRSLELEKKENISSVLQKNVVLRCRLAIGILLTYWLAQDHWRFLLLIL